MVVGGNSIENPNVLDNALMAASSGLSKVSSAIHILGIYLIKMMFPIQLVHEKGFSDFVPGGLGDWRFILSFVVYLGLGIFSLLSLFKKNHSSFGILFFLLSISILCNVFIIIGVHYAERLLYYPLLGFSIATVGALFGGLKAPMKLSLIHI